eukprot:CAMPEP_0202721126 /NCGR_PEP_ID=MMETSP1385-20130828/146286_1 /ASSEMBLY_ACC=CAM_ASM_000861 /TAXON_ID=933848 /ORGANISM="Elphidium margaritaceum" /LENGTH=234 /DNA_ID=CAMNT_0049385199 /DNA_START=135 /DNA_END=836 /DNA_ORIENTATION=-
MELLNYGITVCSAGKIPVGHTEFPFEFELRPRKNMKLFETYHGVYVNVQYVITAQMVRSMLSKNIEKSIEFIVKNAVGGDKDSLVHKKKSKVQFEITPQSLKNVQKQNLKHLFDFRITGHFESGVCNVEEPFMGSICVQSSKEEIKSIELQFVRVETIHYEKHEIREATEVQNVQLADGNVCHHFDIPIYMIFPRLFTCITTVCDAFTVEFEVNVVVLFKDSHMLTENFPIKLV